MSIIKIEFPADRPDIAKVLGEALISVSKLDDGMGCGGCASVSDEVQRTAEPDGFLGSAGLNDGKADPDLSGAGSDDNGMFNKDEIEETNNLVDPANVDTKGVPFNAEFCGRAAKPYYASGKRSGQWKKRQGVDELAYDNWYAAELAKVVPATTGQDNQQAAINTASAFGGQQRQQQDGDANTADVNTGEVAPHDAGTLMAWVSEMQAAGRITQEQVNTAYQQAGVTMPDVFPGPNKTEETIAQAVRNVHTILVSWA